MKRNIIIAGATQTIVDEVVMPMLTEEQENFILVSDKELKFPFEGDQLKLKVVPSEEVAAETVRYAKSIENPVIMKGQIHTSTLLKEILKKEHQLVAVGETLAVVALVHLVDFKRQFIFSDPGLNIKPDVATKIALVKHTVKVAQRLGILKPKVSILSSVEEVNPKMPSAYEAAAVAAHFKQEPLEAIIEGPISMDISVNPLAAKTKNYQGQIQGDADILIMPGIDAGNIMYKALTAWANVSAGNIIMGTKIPIALSSRGDTSATKISSIRLAAKLFS